MNTPILTESAFTFNDGGAQTCTNIVDGTQTSCYHWTVTINVQTPTYDPHAVAENIMNAMVGSGCEQNHAAGACDSNAPTAKSTALLTTASRVSGTWRVLSTTEGGNRIRVRTIGGAFDGYSNGDPHIHRADGKRTDFRGEDGKIFNMLSAKNYSLGVRTVESHFMQKFGEQKVHGTHFTQGFFTLRTNKTGTVITCGVDALITPWVDPVTLVAVSGQEKFPVKLSASTRPTFTMEDVNITAISGAKVLVRAANWEVTLTRRLLYKPLPESKTKNFLDLSIRRVQRDPRALLSHGVIGQSFDPKHRISKNGKQDDYTNSEVTTVAQAEGAIEGVYTDYMVAAPYQTTFKYSLFDAPDAAAGKMSDAAQAGYLTSAFTETDEAASA
jgi:hypothetical protein